MSIPSSREVAIQNGYKLYHSGKPCRNGHDSYRYTLTSVCVQCNRDRSKRNVDKIRNQTYQLGLGLVRPQTHVHPDDLATAEAFLKALKLDRGID